jgi:hypothetical protein
VEVEVLGSVDLYVRSGHGVDPYFHLPMSRPSDGWRKVWFFLRNNTDSLLPVFTSSRPIPQPNWGYGVARQDLRRLQPLHEVIQQLLHGGLKGADLLGTFFSYRVQPLLQRETTRWMYLRSSCLNCSFSEELGNTETNTQIRRVLAHGAILSLGTSPAPLRERVDSP